MYAPTEFLIIRFNRAPLKTMLNSGRFIPFIPSGLKGNLSLVIYSPVRKIGICTETYINVGPARNSVGAYRLVMAGN